MTEKEKAQRKEVLKELIRDIHMPSFCDEEGRCGALDECTDTGEYDCSCCNINRVVKAFNRGIEFQKQKSPWISVEDDLPCNHLELICWPEIDEGTETIKVFARSKYGDIWSDYMVYKNGKWRWHDFEPAYWMVAPKLLKNKR